MMHAGNACGEPMGSTSPSSDTEAVHFSEDTHSSNGDKEEYHLAHQDKDHKEDFQDLFNDLLGDDVLGGISADDMDCLEGYLSDSAIESLSTEQQNSRAWECEPEGSSNHQSKMRTQEEMQEAALKDGKLPRPCIGMPRARPRQSNGARRRCLLQRLIIPAFVRAPSPPSMPLQEGAVQPRISLPSVQALRHPLPGAAHSQKGPPDSERADIACS